MLSPHSFPLRLRNHWRRRGRTHVRARGKEGPMSLGMTGPPHSWTHSGYSCLHKTYARSTFRLRAGKHSQLPSLAEEQKSVFFMMWPLVGWPCSSGRLGHEYMGSANWTWQVIKKQKGDMELGGAGERMNLGSVRGKRRGVTMIKIHSTHVWMNLSKN